VLLVLASTIALVVVTTQRARRLAQLRTDFVASISHELRTPLTGITSAAQNIADGLVDGKERAMRYGAAILSQVQQLSELIEQILLFSATEKGGYRYHYEWVDIPELVATSLSITDDMIRLASVQAEIDVAVEFPPVWADFKALSRCLQNLIANAIKNAIKYGGQSHWIGIRAIAAGSSSVAREVIISVEDKGLGITAEELQDIVEPFYRSPAVTAAQIHGSGLGLSIVEAMGGRLTVQSELGKGSTFNLHLPVVDKAAKEASAKALVEVAAP
jgi:signal transduction histidine kinase